MRDAPPTDGFDAQWRARFERFATYFDNDAGIAGWSTSGLEARFRFFRTRWPRAPRGSKYLDLGCGAGTYTRWLVQQDLVVIGVDYSLPTLVKAKARSPEVTHFCCANGMLLPFRDEAFDGVVCFGLLQAMSGSGPLIAEAARVLKEGGELWIDALNRHSIASQLVRARERFQGKAMHLRYDSSRAVERALTSEGFGDLTRYWLPLVPSRALRLQRVFDSKLCRAVFEGVPMMGSLLSHAFVLHARRRRRHGSESQSNLKPCSENEGIGK